MLVFVYVMSSCGDLRDSNRTVLIVQLVHMEQG